MCPPGVDQTMRSPQRWRIIVPEARQALKLELVRPSRSLELPSSLFSEKPSWDAFSYLARPIVSAEILSRRYQRSIPILADSSKLTALESLSNELLDMIISQLSPEKADIIALGLSSPFLWPVALRYIHAGYINAFGPWAGKMISLQGSYSMTLPKPFMQDGLAAKIAGPNPKPQRWRGSGGGMCEARRFFWALREDVVTAQGEAKKWMTAAQIHLGNMKVPESRWPFVEAELDCSYLEPRELVPKDQAWILRNLSTREIISLRRLADLQRGSGDNTMSFDNILLMRLCWVSMGSDVGEENKSDLYRGAWAGHRLDIVMMEAHQADVKEDWSDITETVMREAEMLRRKLDRL